MLVAPPVLAFTRVRGKYARVVDACDSPGGGTLLQEQEYGSIHPVVYLSRTLYNHERAFGVTEKECLAVVWASLQLMAYLDGNSVLVRTDHDCLRWILSMDSWNSTTRTCRA